MTTYLNQLLDDILASIERAKAQQIQTNDEADYFTDDLEEDILPLAPKNDFAYWTGISQEELPVEEQLSDENCEQLLEAMINLWQAYKVYPNLPSHLPTRSQYNIMRESWMEEWSYLPNHQGAEVSWDFSIQEG